MKTLLYLLRVFSTLLINSKEVLLIINFELNLCASRQWRIKCKITWLKNWGCQWSILINLKRKLKLWALDLSYLLIRQLWIISKNRGFKVLRLSKKISKKSLTILEFRHSFWRNCSHWSVSRLRRNIMSNDTKFLWKIYLLDCVNIKIYLLVKWDLGINHCSTFLNGSRNGKGI